VSRALAAKDPAPAGGPGQRVRRGAGQRVCRRREERRAGWVECRLGHQGRGARRKEPAARRQGRGDRRQRRRGPPAAARSRAGVVAVRPVGSGVRPRPVGSTGPTAPGWVRGPTEDRAGRPDGGRGCWPAGGRDGWPSGGRAGVPPVRPSGPCGSSPAELGCSTRVDRADRVGLAHPRRDRRPGHPRTEARVLPVEPLDHPSRRRARWAARRAPRPTGATVRCAARAAGPGTPGPSRSDRSAPTGDCPRQVRSRRGTTPALRPAWDRPGDRARRGVERVDGRETPWGGTLGVPAAPSAPHRRPLSGSCDEVTARCVSRPTGSRPP